MHLRGTHKHSRAVGVLARLSYQEAVLKENCKYLEVEVTAHAANKPAHISKQSTSIRQRKVIKWFEKCQSIRNYFLPCHFRKALRKKRASSACLLRFWVTNIVDNGSSYYHRTIQTVIRL